MSVTFIILLKVSQTVHITIIPTGHVKEEICKCIYFKELFHFSCAIGRKKEPLLFKGHFARRSSFGTEFEYKENGHEYLI